MELFGSKLGLAGMATILAAVPVSADSPQSALAGNWSLEGASEGTTFCNVKLSNETTIGGYQIVIAKPCLKAYGWAGDVTAWRPAPTATGVTFADALRHAVITFEKLDDTDWVGTAPDRQSYVLRQEKKKR